MKLKLILAFVALSLAACSGDDDTTPVNAEKMLDQVNDHIYENGVLVRVIARDYENNKIAGTLDHNIDNGFYVKYVYEYNSEGLVAVESRYTSDTENFDGIVPFMVCTYEYDDLGRLELITETTDFPDLPEESGVSTSAYTYNDDNTVTRVNDYGGESITYVFYLNASGQVYKQELLNGEVVQEVTYDGNNMISWSNGAFSREYTYADYEVKGKYINWFSGQYGDYQPNRILRGGFINISTGVDKYVSSFSGDASVSYEYDFDEEGYPVSATATQEGIQNYWYTDITYKN
jgi:hypothetical protein